MGRVSFGNQSKIQAIVPTLVNLINNFNDEMNKGMCQNFLYHYGTTNQH